MPAALAALLAAWAVGGAVATAGGRAARTIEPGTAVDPRTFLGLVAREPGDILLLLYSPTCPDCQWYLGHWAKVAQKLQRVPSMAVWTMTDPGFLAPKPFEHWHNPAIFFVPALHKDRPALLSEQQFQAYLQGNSSRPQEAQDDEFQTMLLDFAGQRASLPMVVYPSTLPAAKTAQQHLNQLVAKEWDMLQHRWADTQEYGVAPEPGAPAQPKALPGMRAGPRPHGPCHHSCTRPEPAGHPLQALRMRAAASTVPSTASAPTAHRLQPDLPVIKAPVDRGTPPPILG